MNKIYKRIIIGTFFSLFIMILCERISYAYDRIEVTVYASDINKTENYKFPKTDINLILDEDCEINNMNFAENKSNIYNLVISGDHKLTTGSLQAGTVDVKCRELVVSGLSCISLDVDANSTVTINGGSGINTKTHLKSHGNLNLDVRYGNYAIQGNNGYVEFDGGEYNIKSGIYGISANQIQIKNSNVTVRCRKMAIYADTYIVINNSCVDSEVTDNDALNIFATNETQLKNCYIETPSNARFTTGTIFKEEGGNPEKIVITNQQSSPSPNRGTANNVDNKSPSPSPTKSAYKNEWVNGKWYNADGSQTYTGTLVWKSNSTGWWIEDSSGWYPVSSWQKIDGAWYYFNSSGYMASSEYVDGYWLNGNGKCSNDYYLTWKSNGSGWWVEDKSGWYPSSQWLKIDSCWYFFNSSGYMVTNQYIDGYWIGANGVCN